MPKIRNKKKWIACLAGICLCTILFAIILVHYDISSATAVGEVQITSGYLNVRKGPGMKFSYLKSGGSKVTLSDGKQVTILAKNGKWYHVKFKLAGKALTGYIHSAYVKVLTGNTRTYISGKVSSASVKLYKKADSTSTAIQLNGATLKLAKSTTVKILSEKVVNHQKWYYISTQNGTGKIKGYIRAKYIKVTYKKGMPGRIYAGSTGQKLYKKAGKKSTVKLSGKKVTLSNNTQVTVLNEKKVSGVKYYKISVRVKKRVVKGFIPEYAMKFQIVDREKTGVVPTATPASGKKKAAATATPKAKKTGNASLTKAQFKKKMQEAGFPSDYITKLVELHTLYPSWEFEPYKTGLSWSAALAAESKAGLNLLSNSKSPDWKSTAAGAYDWTTDTYTVYDGTTWVTASQKAVAYYMDPRNFLDSRGIFQFELLEYQSDVQTQSGVENILKNTPMYNTKFSYKKTDGSTGTMKYSKAFIKAASSSGVSPYHLASRSKQEIVISPTMMSSSVSGNVAGYLGIYNFYNIGASNSAGGGAVANGLAWASTGTTYKRPWTDPYRSIVGGGSYIGSQYINVGQNTLYLQKFNVTSKNTYNHQYMANVEAPNSEATKTVSAYGTDLADTPIVFSIPIYSNMPASACPVPSGGANPNNYLKTLSITGYSFKTPFVLGDDGSKTYTLSVANTVSSVRINATAVSSAAVVTGAGTHNLSVGKNTITVQVKSASGSVRSYKVEVTRGGTVAAKKSKKKTAENSASEEIRQKATETPEATEPAVVKQEAVETTEPEKVEETAEPKETETPEE